MYNQLSNFLNDDVRTLYEMVSSEMPNFNRTWDETCDNSSVYSDLNELELSDIGTVLGEERYIPTRFYKDFNIFRLGELTSKIITIDDKFQLPNNSILHVMDNFTRPPISPTKPIITKTSFESCDTPNMNNPLIAQEDFRKFIFHVEDFDTVGPFDYKDKYIFLKMNQNKNMMEFRKRYQSNCKILTSLKNIMRPPSTLNIINHNALFRVVVRGVLPQYRRFNLIFSSILNTVCKCPKDKMQFVQIPLNYEVYQPSIFLKSKDVLNINTLRFKDRMQYMLFVHLYNFLNPDASASLFNKFPKDMYDKVAFMFHSGKYAIIFTFKDMLALCKTPTAYRKFIALMNNLMESAYKDALTMVHTEEISQSSGAGFISTKPSTADEVPHEEEDTEEVTDLGDVVVDEVVETTDKIVESPTVSETLKITAHKLRDDVNTVVTTITVPETESKTIEDYSEPEDKVVTPKDVVESDNFDKDVTAPGDNEEQSIISPDEDDVFEDVEVTSIDALHSIFSNEEELTQPKTPVVRTKPITDKKDVGALGKERIKRIDESADAKIFDSPQLKPNQKTRLQTISRKYKSVQIDNVPISKILSEEISAALDASYTAEVLDDYLTDKSMVKSSINTLDRLYLDKFFEKDLAGVVTSFNKNGMFLTDLQTVDNISEISKTRIYTCKYEDVNNKKHTLKFELPIVDNRGHCLVDGTEYYFKKQIVALPICKLSETKVSLASNYNKTVVQRNVTKAHSFLEYIQRLFNGINATYPEPVIELNHGNNVYDRELPYEYTRLGSRFDKITLIHPENNKLKFTFTFLYNHRFDGVKPSPRWDDLEKEFGVYIGSRTTGSRHIFMDKNNILRFVALDDKMNIISSEKGCLINFLLDLYPKYKSTTTVAPLTEWVDLNLLNKKLPIGFILSYKYGLKTVLDNLKIPYILVPKRGKVYRELTKTDIVIPFSDKNLIIPRYPLAKSLIIAGLRFFDTNQVAFEDMYSPDTYYTLLNMKGISTNYFKGIDSTFELFVDPITEEVLIQMGEPTNFRDLLIRATEMISSDYHKPATSSSNHRIRSYERLNTVLYNEMAKQFSTYMHRTGAGNTFSLEPKAVLRRIMQDQTMMTVEEVNPIHDLKLKTSLTFTGFGGRTPESFVASDRRFSKDSVGVISESTVDSGAVGMTVGSSMDPKIVGIRGLISDDIDESELEPTNILSATALLMPGSTNDDAKRCNFISIQLSHHIPVKDSEVGRIRTGYERVVAHEVSDKYAYAAKLNGVVLSIDENLKMIRIKYTGGEEVVLEYGSDYGYCSDMYVEQDIRTDLKVNQTFKKGDILVYNAGFFAKDPYSSQVDWKHGTYATVALMEVGGTFEDSSIISREFGERTQTLPVFERLITFSKTDVVISCTEVGAQLGVNDHLIVLEDADVSSFTMGSNFSEDVEDFLIGLNRVAPKSKYNGTVVKMNAFYGCDIKEMHPSISKIVRKITSTQDAKYRFGQNSSTSSNYAKSQPLPKDSKYRGIDFNEDTVVLQFLIQEELNSGVGDKQVIDSSLKTIISDVMDIPAETLDGRKVDVIFSGSSISNRIVNSPVLVGIGERIIRKLEHDIIEEYFD